MCQLLSCSEHGAHAPATMSPKCIDLVDKGNGGGASEAALYWLIQGRSQQLPEIGPALPHTPAISHQPIASPTMAASRLLGLRHVPPPCHHGARNASIASATASGYSTSGVWPPRSSTWSCAPGIPSTNSCAQAT